MFHPLANLFSKPSNIGWGKNDIKYFIQNYLRERLKTDSLYCDEVGDEIAHIRVNTAALKQEIILLAYDLSQKLKQDTGFQLTNLKIDIRN